MIELTLIVKLSGLFVFLGWIPGYLLTRWLRIELTGQRAVLLVIPFVFGIPLTSVVYFLLRYFALGRFFLAFPLGMLGLGVSVWAKGGLGIPTLRFSRSDLRDSAIFLILLSMVGAIFISHASRTYYDKEGGLVLGDGAYTDCIWAASVTAALKQDVPPRFPLLQGHRLRYHYLGHLFGELLYRLSGARMTMVEFTFRYLPAFFIILLLGAIYVGLKVGFERSSIAFWGIGLAVFAPLRDVVFFKNHNSFAVTLLFVSVFYLWSLYERNPNRKGSLWGALLLLGLMPLYDGAMGAVAYGTVFFFAVSDSMKRRAWSPLLTGWFIGAAVGGLIYLLAVGSPSETASALVIGKGPQMAVARERFKWLTNPMKIFLNSLPGSHTLLGHILVECVKGVYHTVFFLLSLFLPPKDAPLQYHFLALPLAFSILRNPARFPRNWIVAIGMAIAGILVTTFISYKGGPGSSMIAYRAIELAPLVLTPFTALAIVSILSSRRPSWGWGVLVLCFFLYVFPGYYQNSFFLKPTYYSYMDRPTLEVLNFLRDKTPASSVVLHPFRNDPVYRIGKGREKPDWVFEDHYFYVSALGERQAVFEGASTSATYLLTDASYEEVVERIKEVTKFYTTADKEWVQSFLKRYKVNYVWVPREKSLQFKATELLHPVLENSKHVLFEVVK